MTAAKLNAKFKTLVRRLEQRLKGPVLAIRRPLVVCLHLLAAAASYLFAFALVYDFAIPPAVMKVVLGTLPVIVACRVAGFLYFDLFRGLWRFVTMSDVLSILKANLTSSAMFAVTLFFILGHGLGGLPRSVLLLDWFLCTGLLVALRLASRLYRETFHIHQRPTREVSLAIIAGAGGAGFRLAQEVKNNPLLGLKVVGFLDDEPTKKGAALMGIPVLGRLRDLAEVANHAEISTVLVAMPSAPMDVQRWLQRECRSLDLSCRVLPSTQDIFGHLPLWSQMRELDPEEIMGRAAVRQRDEHFRLSSLSGKVVLVSGAAGSIGSELCRQLARRDPRLLIMLDQNESGLYDLDQDMKFLAKDLPRQAVVCDVVDRHKVEAVFDRQRPDVIFHAAAYKHVPMMEAEPVEALAANLLGTYHLARAAAAVGAEKFVLISTDKAVNPVSVMGMTKFAAEKVVESFNGGGCAFVAVRFGNVINSNGSVVPLFRKQVEQGGPVTVTHPEVSRFFMSIAEAVHLVQAAADMGHGGEVFLLDMGQPVKIVDVARKIIAAADPIHAGRVEIVFTGLRPGEKLHEELYWQGEGVRPTPHPKIKALLCQRPDLAELERHIARIGEIKRRADDQMARQFLLDFVARFNA